MATKRLKDKVLEIDPQASIRYRPHTAYADHMWTVLDGNGNTLAMHPRESWAWSIAYRALTRPAEGQGDPA